MTKLVEVHLKNEIIAVNLATRTTNLLLYFNIDEIRSCKITTMLLELCHQFLFNDSKTIITINANIQQSSLIFSFLYSKQENKNKKSLLVFDQVNHSAHNDKEQLDCSIKLDHQKLKADKNFLSGAKKILGQKSQEELINEIAEKNEKLTQMINKLKSSSEMVQTEKMRALGIMTAGVAHELNNPMMGILNYIQYGILKTKDNQKLNKVLVDAEREVKRCISIVSNLLTFSRIEKEGGEEFIETNIHEIIERVINILSFKCKKDGVKLVTHCDKKLTSEIQPQKYQQVIMNIATNAIDALENSEEKIITITANATSGMLIVQVEDTGSGIPDEVINKMFDPFFTTKSTDKGTGLGLSVCRGIIEGHGGDLCYNTTDGKGTKCIIKTPLKHKEE